MNAFKLKYPKIKCKNKELKKIIDKHVIQAKKHFKEEGHDLDVSFITEDIIYDFFGEHITEYLYGQLCKIDNVHIELSIKDRHVRKLAQKSDYFCVKYDYWENKIVILDRDYDVFKYREVDGYIHLGSL